MTRRSHPLLAALLTVLACAAPAPGQDPQVDPDSPAGTEYELPLDRAREEAGAGAGTGGSSSGATGETPLFGEGIKARTTAQPAKAKGTAGTDSDPSTIEKIEADGSAKEKKSLRAQAASPETGGGLVAIGVAAAGVLLVGALTGLLWRRRSRA